MKHMWPSDLENMFGRLNNLNTAHGFPAGARAFIVGEVIDYGGDVISASEYHGFSTTTEFRYSMQIGNVFNGQTQLRW